MLHTIYQFLAMNNVKHPRTFTVLVCKTRAQPVGESCSAADARIGTWGAAIARASGDKNESGNGAGRSDDG